MKVKKYVLSGNLLVGMAHPAFTANTTLVSGASRLPLSSSLTVPAIPWAVVLQVVVLLLLSFARSRDSLPDSCWAGSELES